jgi:hypothetical protein
MRQQDWGWKEGPFYVFFTPQRFDTAKTASSPFAPPIKFHDALAGHHA